MKKFLFLVLSVTFLLTSFAFGQSSTITTPNTGDSSMKVTRVNWVADGSGDVTILVQLRGYVYMVVTDPAANAPTTLYDITIADEDGVDIMEGGLADLSATVSNQFSPTINGSPGARWVQRTLSIVVDNAGEANEGEVIIYTYLER